MIPLFTALYAIARDRAKEARRADDGALSIEQVVYAALAVTLALAIAIAIKAFVDGRIGGIAG